MIHEFVDKIVVHEADKSSGDRIQQIDIYLKYVGKLDVPMPELTPEQMKEEDRKRRKRALDSPSHGFPTFFFLQHYVML